MHYIASYVAIATLGKQLVDDVPVDVVAEVTPIVAIVRVVTVVETTFWGGEYSVTCRAREAIINSQRDIHTCTSGSLW